MLKQHDELLVELVRNTDELKRSNSFMEKRLHIMETIQAIFIPVMTILGLSGLAALLKVFALI